MKCKNIILKILSFYVFILAGCSSNSLPMEGDVLNSNITESITEEHVLFNEDTNEEANTDNKSFTFMYFDSLYMQTLLDKFKEAHPEITIDVKKAINEESFLTMLMAGNAPDLFWGFWITYDNPETVKMLADFYPLMNADPEFNQDDYFMNMINSMSYNGGLYAFPLNATVYTVAANNRVSDELTQKFVSYDSVSLTDMLEMRNTIPGAKDYYLYSQFDIVEMYVKYEENMFIDFDKRTCDFNNPSFIKLLADSLDATEPQKAFASSKINSFYNKEEDAALSQKYLFQVNFMSFQYMFSYIEQLCFSDAKPIANERGEILISIRDQYCISEKSENKELAWEFVKFMVNPKAWDESMLGMTPVFNVNKSLFRTAAKQRLTNDLESYEEHQDMRINGDIESEVQEVITKLEDMLNKPLCSNNNTYRRGISANLDDILRRVHRKTMTVEQAASEIQNRISLSLME